MSFGNEREFIDLQQLEERKEQAMKCPLTVLTGQNNAVGNSRFYGDCLKEECAWWRDDIQMCAIKDLSLELGYSQQRLADIADKMPHAGQFTK